MGALCIFCNRRIGKGHIGLINAKNIPPCNANQTNALEIVIYVPLCLSDGKIGLINTLNHELIHAYDNCKRGGIKDCQSYWYGEIRGSYFGQCAQNKSEKARKECAIRGAKKSIKKGLASMQKKFTKEQMKMWNSCYPNEKVANDYAEKAYIEMKKNPANPFAK